MVSDQAIKFYLTPAHDCSYFNDRQATTLFVDPRKTVNSNQFAVLTENGFRRSGDYIYRPHCESCQACESLRVPLATFSPSRSQKRVIKKNQDLKVEIKEATFSQEYYELYARYINIRHRDGDMFPASESQFRSFLLAPFSTGRFVEFRLNGRLIAVSVIDQLPDALSAIYCFFDPDFEERSLGSFAILWQLKQCAQENLRYLYLGYYIENSKKMSYKNKYKPYQLYKNDYWQNPVVET